VAFDPVEKTRTGETAIVYAGFATEPKDGNGGGLLVSTDGGVSWGLVNGQPKGLVPHHLALDAKGGVYVAYGNGLGPNGVTDGAVWKMDPDTGAWTDITPVKPRRGDVFGYGGLSLDPSPSRRDRGLDPRSLGPGRRRLPQRRRRQELEGPARQVRARHRRRALGPQPGEQGRPGHGPLDRRHRHRPDQSDEAIYVTGYGLWRTQDLTEADRSGRTHWRFDDEGLEETVALELVSPPGLPLVSTIGDIGGFRHDDLIARPAAAISTRTAAPIAASTSRPWRPTFWFEPATRRPPPASARPTAARPGRPSPARRRATPTSIPAASPCRPTASAWSGPCATPPPTSPATTAGPGGRSRA
jgi:xyloglucan-specific exo-beta-1,4-glucanase